MRMRMKVGSESLERRPRSLELSPSPADLLCSWEEDRKWILHGWSFIFIFLATLLVFNMVDGRMAYVHGAYTGFIGLWIDCRRHKCANVGQFTGQCIHRLWVLIMGARGDYGVGHVRFPRSLFWGVGKSSQ